MAETPRTDALYSRKPGEVPWTQYCKDGYDLARTLELELAKTREALREALSYWNAWCRPSCEDELKRIAQLRKEFGL